MPQFALTEEQPFASRAAVRRALWAVAVAAMLAPAVAGCNRYDVGAGGGDGGKDGSPAEAKPDPKVFTRSNYYRVKPGMTLAEVQKIFGPPQKKEPESGVTRYVWIAGAQKFEVFAENDRVRFTLWPGKDEDDRRRREASGAAGHVVNHLREYAISHRNRMPQRPEELDQLRTEEPKAFELLKSGEVVVPWGQSANRLVWAYWKDTPEFGGPYLRFDGKGYDDCDPAQFKRLKDVLLTSATIPEDVAGVGKPGPGQPTTLKGREERDKTPPGFWTADALIGLLKDVRPGGKWQGPASLDEFPKHLIRNWGGHQVLKALESGEVVVRWGRDPTKGLYAYPRGFPESGGWAIRNGSYGTFEGDEARKVFTEP